jgi:hypothetical protein
MNKVHVIADRYSTLYLKRMGGTWRTIWRDKHGDWHQIAAHRLLSEAKREAHALLANN